jgi:hypothetical protein
MRAQIGLQCAKYAKYGLGASKIRFGSNGAAIALAQDYLTDGAYADFARDRARGVEDTALEAAIARVVAKADESRDGDDARFAAAYAGWLASGSPASEHVVPIHEGLERYVERFLRDGAHRKLLVLRLDGMSWANAVELLQSCEEVAYAPLRSGRAAFRPMLAAMPSITGVSRSAFFGGKA